jgi:hypothetical protein
MFRARIGHVRYCSHRYRIAALRQYMARPAKPIKGRPDKDRAMTTRPSVMMEQQDLVTAHSNHPAHRQTSSVRPRPKLANVRIACTLECDRPRIGRIA